MGKLDVKLPQIGDTVTSEEAVELCSHFGLDYLVERIEADPGRYKPWVFDGCSCLMDQWLGLFAGDGKTWEDITYECCLPHDLKYMYGEPGNEEERKQADIEFERDLIEKALVDEDIAHEFFYTGVRVGGGEELGLPFSWAAAQK